MEPGKNASRGFSETSAPTSKLFGDAKIIAEEVSKIKDSENESTVKITQVQRKVEEINKRVQQATLIKVNLKKENAELKYNLEDGHNQRMIIENRVQELHDLSEDVENLTIRAENTLRSCNLDKTLLVHEIEKLNELITNNLQKLKGLKEERNLELGILKEKVTQHGISRKEKVQQLGDQIIKMSIDLTDANNKNQLLKESLKENEESNETCCLKISDVQQKAEAMQEEVQSKRKKLQESIDKKEQTLYEYQQQIEDKSKALKNKTFETEEEQRTNELLERAIQNQKEYNNNLMKQVTDLEGQVNNIKQNNEQLENGYNQKKMLLEENKEHFQRTTNCKLIELQSRELTMGSKRELLKMLKQDIIHVDDGKREIFSKIQQLKSHIDRLKEQKEALIKDVHSESNMMSLSTSKLQNLKEDIMKCKMETATLENDTSEEIKNLTILSTTLDQKIETCKQDEQTTRSEILNEISQIKKSFDEKAKDYADKENSITGEIQKCDLEISNTLLIQTNLDEELDNLNKECELLISGKNKKDDKPNKIQWTPLPTFVPFQNPAKIRKVHDEVNANSAANTNINYDQFLMNKVEYKRKKKETVNTQSQEWSFPKEKPKRKSKK